MKIIDINGKEREASSLKIVTHNRSTDSFIVRHENVEGELLETREKQIAEVDEDYVEAVIQADNSDRFWTEWYPREKFEQLNPEVKLE